MPSLPLCGTPSLTLAVRMRGGGYAASARHCAGKQKPSATRAHVGSRMEGGCVLSVASSSPLRGGGPPTMRGIVKWPLGRADQKVMLGWHFDRMCRRWHVDFGRLPVRIREGNAEARRLGWRRGVGGKGGVYAYAALSGQEYQVRARGQTRTQGADHMKHQSRPFGLSSSHLPQIRDGRLTEKVTLTVVARSQGFQGDFPEPHSSVVGCKRYGAQMDDADCRSRTAKMTGFASGLLDPTLVKAQQKGGLALGTDVGSMTYAARVDAYRNA
ncbi:hypothetical protein F5148DRAFT_1148222 [Russula earlei]|uniref:Uncharacterized protein n=1 Tax=Russula earlei TaxID=71964 RepID=A0ACC0UCX9_9AGAM|nr:hypothetical protein F5148DRAFT_1148222 [Russula earlei]